MAEGPETISVVVPVLDEEAEVHDSLQALRAIGPDEIVVVDGGSRDRTLEIARALADRTDVVPRGRARQLNRGAALARGRVLLFVHVDTRLPGDALAAIRTALADESIAGGAFRVAIRHRALRYRMIEWGANLRARIAGIPYGDQAVFVRREAFEALGGFPPLPILEDVAFSQSLKRMGRIALLPQRVLNSPRRWAEEGFVYATVRNWIITLLFTSGVPAGRLARWYPTVR